MEHLHTKGWLRSPHVQSFARAQRRIIPPPVQPVEDTMSDLLKLVLDADDSVDRLHDIKTVTLTVRLSRRVEIDGASRVVKVSYRREVVQLIEEAAGEVTITNSRRQTEERNQACFDL
jgi:hypothetical protein